MDSRPDEQQRGITMKSSSISLNFALQTTTLTNYQINLIDSPGHVDFGYEVSTAAKLADGALILVDCCEGVCTQTLTVLKQAYTHGVTAVLVLNKMDRLITELGLSPEEAYQKLRGIVEQVNAVMSMLFRGDLMENDARMYDKNKNWEFKDEDDSHIYFDPRIGNVIFASAVDGWAFGLDYFAQLMCKKVGKSEEELLTLLWGDHYLDGKKIIQHADLKGKTLKPLFVQFVLENIWKVYESCLILFDQDSVERMCLKLGVKVNPREINSKDKSGLLRSVMGGWIPLSRCVLLSVVRMLPSPLESQPKRMTILLDQMNTESNTENEYQVPDDIQDALYGCDSLNNHKIGYIAKMFSIPKTELPENKRVQLTAEELRALRAQTKLEKSNPDLVKKVEEKREEINNDEEEENEVKEALIGFARLYSGSLVKGDKVFILGPKYSPKTPTLYVTEFEITTLYQLMGRDLHPLDTVTAGMIFGIGGLDALVLKTATISSTLLSPSLQTPNSHGNPLVRVAIEPKNASDIHKVTQALKLLNASDSCVEVLIQESGELVIVAAGELHLERCLADVFTYCGCEVSVSEPIVIHYPYFFAHLSISFKIGFRESIVEMRGYAKGVIMSAIQVDEEVKDADESEVGSVVVYTPNQLCTIGLRAVPIPGKLVEFIELEHKRIKKLGELSLDEKESLGFWTSYEKVCDSKELLENSLGIDWKSLAYKIFSFGPKRAGGNLLVWDIDGYTGKRMMQPPHINKESHRISDFETSIHTGFQLATTAGPLCAEPMSGVCFFIQKMTFQDSIDNTKSAMLSGQIISTIRDGCRLAFMKWSSRLMLATYTCDLQAPSEVLGKVYAVIARRKGRILSEEMQDGTPFFRIRSVLPVIESFGFVDDIRKRTSGAASAQFVFGGYEVLDIDPFWIPTTEDEIKLMGDKSDRENLARKYVEMVRKRKGLVIDQKVVEHAEKQKTMKTNK